MSSLATRARRNLLRLPAITQQLLVMWHRPWVSRLLRDSTEPIRIRMLNGPRMNARDGLLVSHPDHVRQVFAGSPSAWHAGECYQIIKPLVGEHSVLLQDRTEHARSRKLLMPAFTASALRGYEAMVEQLAKEEVRRWPTGQVFRAQDHMQRVTLEIILRVVFGVSEGDRLVRLRALVPPLNEVNPLVLIGMSHARLAELPPMRRTREIQREVTGLLRTQITERRKGEPGDHADVLARLLEAQVDGDRLSDDELIGHLITLLLAGHETTATAMTWTLHELARLPELQDRARQAAMTGDLGYLEAVVKESMRLHPVIAIVARALSEPAEFDAVTVPAGHAATPSISLAHFNAEHFPEPEEFRPERFLADPPPSANTWFPFGGGVRRCIGASFSLMEARILLREILLSFDLRPDRDRPERPKARNVVVSPHRGGRIIATPRTA
ncbi:cytochrome P450 [Pseudonocardiaceae bacterium YIM PH 21723]|nr:cytochrome P450 [Pseudonocardiaceae bacterium YIM PH 21723]